MAMCATVATTTTTMASLINQNPLRLLQCKFPTINSSSKSQPTSIVRCKLSHESSGNSTSETSLVGPRRRRVEVGPIIGLMAAAAVLMGPTLEADATRIEYYATVAEPSCEMNYVRSGLAYCDLVVGSGPQAPYNDLINVHYTARFGDGIVFDSSYKRGRPLTMRIGVGKVIRGLDQGIFGGDGVPPMQVGGKRKLQIPPELAYGPEPAGCFSGDCNIPANATLLYDINFVNIYSGNRK